RAGGQGSPRGRSLLVVLEAHEISGGIDGLRAINRGATQLEIVLASETIGNFYRAGIQRVGKGLVRHESVSEIREGRLPKSQEQEGGKYPRRHGPYPSRFRGRFNMVNVLFPG